MTGTTPPKVAVAFSGGRDSLALLHATCRAARALGLGVVALHVHHGLQPEADAWLARAQAVCARWRRRGWPLQLRWARLAGGPAAGDSVEAWARQARYQALARLADEAGASLVLLGHHRQDQAETLLLQALRGGGPAGLSAMPARALRAGLVWARPWLDQSPRAIDHYVERHRLQPVHDPSNQDPALARSRLRGQVWPALTAAFADAEQVLAAAARRQQEAAAALAELAVIDLADCVDPDGALQVAPWRRLSPARQANALRAWWRGLAGRSPPETLVQRLLAEVPAQGAARWPAGAGGCCRCHRGRLQRVAAQPGARVLAADGPMPALRLDLARPGRVAVPAWDGSFEVEAVPVGGACTRLLMDVQLRQRVGGERFQARPGSLPRSLKKQYQASAVPADDRRGPLVWSADERLLFVPGLGIDARCLAPAGEPQWRLLWRPGWLPSGPDKAAG